MSQITFPTETEIYILPTGEVIIADLPAELQRMTAHLGNDASAAPQVRPDDPPINPPRIDQASVPTDY